MSDTQPRRRRNALRIALAAVAIVGIGAAVTTAVWTDNVFFSATATASSYDLQGRAGTSGAWLDVGIPGDSDTTPITLTSDDLAALSPSMDFDIPFQLCNIGTTAGTISAVSTPALTGDLFTAAGVEITVTVTAPTVGDATPSDPGCAAPIDGTLNVTTTADFPATAQSQTGTITFNVTGTSD
ncbi:hypothetical protein ASF62_05795 [Leifsonia sp. Leaf325]|nr:hypothetical protein [Leifsonia sp. Leaf325]KQQ93718.1 hypothetical protein ASF62_05795 [Leifsonia sp. Leaf325]